MRFNRPHISLRVLQPSEFFDERIGIKLCDFVVRHFSRPVSIHHILARAVVGATVQVPNPTGPYSQIAALAQGTGTH